MALPSQEKFTLDEVAQLRGWTTNYVEELVYARKFKHIIVKGELIAGSSLTRHVYFDQALWIEHFGDKVTIDPVTRKKEYEADVKREQAYWEKEYGQRAKLHQTKHGEEIKFNPAGLEKWYEQNVCKTFCNIGPNEVAYLWQPSFPSAKWALPEEGTIYIPRVALEAFEKNHGLKAININKGKNNDDRTAPDLSEVLPDRWYTVDQAARLLDLAPKYLRNDLIPLGKLKAEKRGKRNLIKGTEILNYAKRFR